MIPEERFGRWVAIGVPSLLIIGVSGVSVIHTCYAIVWRQLLIPFSLYIGLQIGAYIGAFWTGKWARQQSRYWPLFWLAVFYSWGTGLIIIRYGVQWKILPAYGTPLSFSLCMAVVTVIAFLAVKFGKPFS